MSSPQRWLALALGAGAFGVVDSFANASGGLEQGPLVRSLARLASYLLNAGWAWAALAVAAGWLIARWARPAPGEGSVARPGGAPAREVLGAGALAGCLAAACAVLAYYVSDCVLRAEPFGWYVQDLLVWLLAAVLLCAPLGALGALARRAGLLGLLARLVVPAGAALQMLVLAPGFDDPPVQPVHLEAVLARWLVLVAAAGAVLLLVRRWWRQPARRGALLGGVDV